MGPVFAFSNGYGEGLTNSNPLSNYGKITVLIIASWAGPQGDYLWNAYLIYSPIKHTFCFICEIACMCGFHLHAAAI